MPLCRLKIEQRCDLVLRLKIEQRCDLVLRHFYSALVLLLLLSGGVYLVVCAARILSLQAAVSIITIQWIAQVVVVVVYSLKDPPTLSITYQHGSDQ